MNQHDFANLLRILNFAVEKGLVETVDDAKVVIVLEAKLKQAFEEALSGNDVPGSPE